MQIRVIHTDSQLCLSEQGEAFIASEIQQLPKPTPISTFAPYSCHYGPVLYFINFSMSISNGPLGHTRKNTDEARVESIMLGIALEQPTRCRRAAGSVRICGAKQHKIWPTNG